MVKKKKFVKRKYEKNILNGTFWKIFIIIIFGISAFALILAVENYKNNLPKKSFETKIIELHDDNVIINDVVVGYLCDEGVYVNQIYDNYVYFSTWHGDASVKQEYKGMSAKCMIKIKHG